MPIQRLHTSARMSRIVIHGHTLYLAGQVGEDMNAGIEQQARETRDNIESRLRQAGTDKPRILSVTILPEGHRCRFRRHECGLGSVAAGRRRAGACHGGGQALRARDPG